MYNYGKSIINSKLKYEFKDNNAEFAKKRESFTLEIKVYCGRKVMYYISKRYYYVTINYAIKNIFKNEIEKNCVFHKGQNYYATFKAFELKPVVRYKYEKTDTLIHTERRKYLLQERINIYF